VGRHLCSIGCVAHRYDFSTLIAARMVSTIGKQAL
jgi:hypothetical protein